MPEPARKKAFYEDLNAIPENATGEIIHGELIVTPRPSRQHVFAATALGGELTPPYQFARGGGPGGWIILIEPEIKLDEDILVPDLAAWRRERFPTSEEHNWISVVPDWVCEILSPYSLRTDKFNDYRLKAKDCIGRKRPFVTEVNSAIRMNPTQARIRPLRRSLVHPRP